MHNVVKALFGGISILMMTGCSQDPVSISNDNSNPEYLASTSQHGNRTSTYKGVNIEIYETNPVTQGIDVAVYTNNNKKTINNMTLSGLNDQQVLAKVNCAFMQDRSSSGDAFYGINYSKQKLYMRGQLLNSTTDSRLSELNTDNQFYPSFCIRTDWSSAIRWPRHDDGSQNANYCIPATIRACRTIIGSGHALVYERQNVFTQTVNDNQGYPIYISDYSTKDRFNHIIGEPFNTTSRTLFGQKNDNSFLMVVVEKPGLTVKECANLMVSLGCINAVNFDGGGSSLMTVGGNKVTTIGSTGSYYGTAVMAYSKYGDVNDDGSTNSIDFGIMRQYLLGLNNLADNPRSDVNGDGSVNGIDAGFMRQYLLGIISKYPADR